MQLDFSEEQKELGASVRPFFEKECASSVVREVMCGEAPFHAGLWAKLGEQGFLAAAIPEQYGGVGADYSGL
ncbi:MAG: acyl-CoA dehydrogenase family protein [Novosphingobium sp.]